MICEEELRVDTLRESTIVMVEALRSTTAVEAREAARDLVLTLDDRMSSMEERVVALEKLLARVETMESVVAKVSSNISTWRWLVPKFRMNGWSRR